MSPHCHSPGSASAPATSAGSAPDSELCICSTIQHHDDFSAGAAKCAADQHQSAAEQHTTRHSRGHLHTGPTDPVGRQPKLILGEILLFKLSCFSRQSLWFSYGILISSCFFFLISFCPGFQQVSSSWPSLWQLQWLVEQSWCPPPCSWDRWSLRTTPLVVNR